jgi:hypothetical protein
VNTANLDQTAAIRSVISNITHSLIMDTTALAVVLLVAGIGIRRYEKQIGSLLSSLYLKLNKTK